MLRAYNKTILDSTRTMLSNHSIKWSILNGAITIHADSKEQAQSLKDVIDRMIDKHSDEFLEKFGTTQPLSDRWCAFTSKIYQPTDPTPKIKNKAEMKDDGESPPKKTATVDQRKITVKYQNNPEITNLLESSAKLNGGYELFTTRQSGAETSHEIVFIHPKLLTLFKYKLRTMNYAEENFKFEDITIEDPMQDKVKVIFQKIKNTKF